ncbi:type III secretion system outer membrane ring subunit SctC [Chitinivorax sp. PXF-14]|uniref:type III secretion system outer membrane ring subunit SctC n=1 Tax=Chitinivorax sp. PXF-14 TaxID=3230488 RepID=UPI00346767C9
MRSNVWLAALCLLLACTSSVAAAIPWGGRIITVKAQEQPLPDFLQSFLGSQGFILDISEQVKGTVSGSFNGRPKTIFDKIVRTYSLLPYYDGAVLHVYAASEAQTKTYGVSPQLIGRVVQTLGRLDVLDEKHTFRALADEGVLMVSGSRRFIDDVDNILSAAQINASSGPAMFRLFKLKYAWAADVTLNQGGREVKIPGVASTLRNLMLSSRRGQLEKPARATVDKLRGQGMKPGEPKAPAEPKAERQPDGADDMFAPAQLPLNAEVAYIEADKRMNAVIVRDTRDRMPMYEQLIRELDVETPLVEIQATIVDVSRDKMQELGINWRWKNGRYEALQGRGDSSDLGLADNGQSVIPSGEGLLLSTILGDKGKFIARLQALQQQGSAKIVSRPQVLTLSNEEALLANNQNFYVRVAGAYEVDLFNVTAGTAMKVVPHVIREGDKARIRLLVNIEDGKITGEPKVDQIPVVEKSTLATQAMIWEGESLLIGGLTRDQNGNAESKIPLLGDLPIIGHLFKTTSSTDNHMERLFMITPRLVPAERVAAAPLP